MTKSIFRNTGAILTLASIVFFAFGCESDRANDASAGEDGSPTAGAPSSVRADSPQPLTAALFTIGLEADPMQAYFVGILACADHIPRHTAETLEDMQQLSEELGCKGWHYVGVVTSNEAAALEAGDDFRSIDATVFDDE